MLTDHLTISEFTRDFCHLPLPLDPPRITNQLTLGLTLPPTALIKQAQKATG